MADACRRLLETMLPPLPPTTRFTVVRHHRRRRPASGSRRCVDGSSGGSTGHALRRATTHVRRRRIDQLLAELRAQWERRRAEQPVASGEPTPEQFRGDRVRGPRGPHAAARLLAAARGDEHPRARTHAATVRWRCVRRDVATPEEVARMQRGVGRPQRAGRSRTSRCSTSSTRLLGTPSHRRSARGRCAAASGRDRPLVRGLRSHRRRRGAGPLADAVARGRASGTVRVVDGGGRPRAARPRHGTTHVGGGRDADRSACRHHRDARRRTTARRPSWRRSPVEPSRSRGMTLPRSR
jgi:hypothetical protein